MNINTATIKELSSLEGIGKKKAQSIIKYRQKNNSFMKIEDLKSVKGIGNKIFRKIKDQIAVEQPTLYTYDYPSRIDTTKIWCTMEYGIPEWL